jgi:hypothetical protein
MPNVSRQGKCHDKNNPVRTLAQNTCMLFEFTAEVWGNNKDDGRKHRAVDATNKDYFPFLDMEMYWSTEGNLQFKVHLKENQILKYLNCGSTHTEACFAAIPTGAVMKRLASLTSGRRKTCSHQNDIVWTLFDPLSTTFIHF